MGGMVQRLVLAACGLTKTYRQTESWLNKVWGSSREQYGKLTLERLNVLLESFSGRGLLNLPDKVFLPLTSLEQLSELPSLTRAMLRDMFPALEELYHGKKQYVLYKTGGTSGQPTKLYRPKNYSLVELASAKQMLDVVGWQPGMVRIALWGSQRDLNLGVGPRRSVKRSINQAMQQVLFYATYKSDEAIYLQFIESVLRYRKCAIYGYPTFMAECARLMESRGIEIPDGQVAALWTTAEMLTPSLREVIAQAFKVKPRDFYGTREGPSISSECEYGSKHINPRYIVETLGTTDADELAEDEAGELAVTDLFNFVTPLVRYRIGDSGRTSWRTCACGRNGLVLDSFDGRTADSYVLKSGLRRTAIWFTDIVRYKEVTGSQLARTGPDSFEVRYTGTQLPDDAIKRMREVATYMLEGAEVKIRLVDRVSRTPEGKCMVFVDETHGGAKEPTQSAQAGAVEVPPR